MSEFLTTDKQAAVEAEDGSVAAASARLAMLDEALAFHTKKARDTADVRATIARAFAGDPVDIALYGDDLGAEGWTLMLKSLAAGELACTGLWFYGCGLGDANVGAVLQAANVAGDMLKNLNVGKCGFTASVVAELAAWKAAHKDVMCYFMNNAWGEEEAKAFQDMDKVYITDFEEPPLRTPTVGAEGSAIFHGKNQTLTVTAVAEDETLTIKYEDGTVRSGIVQIVGLLT
jgi:hypothetical protein